jgi:carbon starvation protein
MAAFINGSALFVSQFGIAEMPARHLVALIAVSFALTTLDSATRLLRYNIEEVADTAGLGRYANRYVSSLIAVLAIGFFAFFRIDGQPAGLALWAVFGTTNQLLGALTLLAVTLYLMQRRGPYLVTLIPTVFVLVMTVAAMVWNMRVHLGAANYMLVAVGAALLGLAVWLCVEAALRVRLMRAGAGDGPR